MKRLAVVLATAAPIAATLFAGAASATPGVGPVPLTTRTVTELTGFRSPAGNIGCYIDTDTVRCDIREADWPRPPRPADCPYSYGDGIWINPYIEPGVAQIVCAGDTAIDDRDAPLPYGDSIVAGPMRCDSAESGMACRDADSGHGFVISRESYRIF